MQLIGDMNGCSLYRAAEHMGAPYGTYSLLYKELWRRPALLKKNPFLMHIRPRGHPPTALEVLEPRMG